MYKLAQNTHNSVSEPGLVIPAFSFLCHRHICGSEGTWHFSGVWLWRSQRTEFESYSSSLKCVGAYQIAISFWKYPQSTRTIAGYVSITHQAWGCCFPVIHVDLYNPVNEQMAQSRNLPTWQSRENAGSMVSPTSDSKFSVHSTPPQLCFIYRRITMNAKEIFSFLKKASSFLGVFKITLL